MGWLSLGVSGVLTTRQLGRKRAQRTKDNFSSSCNSAAPWSDYSLPVGRIFCSVSIRVYICRQPRCVAMSRRIWAISCAADPSAASRSPPTLSAAHHEELKLRFSPYCNLLLF